MKKLLCILTGLFLCAPSYAQTIDCAQEDTTLKQENTVLLKALPSKKTSKPGAYQEVYGYDDLHYIPTDESVYAPKSPTADFFKFQVGTLDKPITLNGQALDGVEGPVSILRYPWRDDLEIVIIRVISRFTADDIEFLEAYVYRKNQNSLIHIAGFSYTTIPEMGVDESWKPVKSTFDSFSDLTVSVGGQGSEVLTIRSQSRDQKLTIRTSPDYVSACKIASFDL